MSPLSRMIEVLDALEPLGFNDEAFATLPHFCDRRKEKDHLSTLR